MTESEIVVVAFWTIPIPAIVRPIVSIKPATSVVAFKSATAVASSSVTAAIVVSSILAAVVAAAVAKVSLFTNFFWTNVDLNSN